MSFEKLFKTKIAHELVDENQLVLEQAKKPEVRNKDLFSMDHIITVFLLNRLKVKNTNISKTHIEIELYKELSADKLKTIRNKLGRFDITYSHKIVTLEIKK